MNNNFIITEINIVPVKPMSGLVAFASFVFNNQFYFGSIGIYTRPNGGHRLTYPTKKNGFNSINIYHPIDSVVSKYIEDTIIKKYEELTSQSDSNISYE